MRAPARQGHLGGVPGADEFAQPGVHRGRADRRGAAHPRGPEPAAGPAAGAGPDGRSRHPRAARPPERLSARAFGRPAAARDDRDGHRLRAQAADRRRADHGAGRHGAAADRRPAGAPAGAPEDEHAVHQPRPGPGGRGGGQRGGDAAGRSARSRPRRRDLQRAARCLHPRAAGLPAPAGHAPAPPAGDRRHREQPRRSAPSSARPSPPRARR